MVRDWFDAVRAARRLMVRSVYPFAPLFLVEFLYFFRLEIHAFTGESRKRVYIVARVEPVTTIYLFIVFEPKKVLARKVESNPGLVAWQARTLTITPGGEKKTDIHEKSFKNSRVHATVTPMVPSCRP